MKRRDYYNHMDRNHTAINGNYQQPHHTNIVSPEFLLGQLWIQEQESNGVKIIELDSNSSHNDGNDDEQQALSHAWSYVNQDRFRIPKSPRNDYEVNYKAREKHRQNKTRYKEEISSPEDEEISDDCVRNFFYSNDQDGNNDTAYENQKSHHKIDCFTTTSQYPKTSDSSTDVEFIDRNDLKSEIAWNAAKSRYYDEILTCDSNLDEDKRTIYIYSFKNKHLFTENDGNNNSNGSSTSTDVGDEQAMDPSNGRVPSPIPDIYVPKLNFIQPPKLPTVTEITEPKSSDENLKTKYEAKMPNGWIKNNFRRYEDTEFDRGSTNLISWMSLSPRERRRRGTFCENCRRQTKLQVVREASPIAEEVVQNTTHYAQGNSPVLGDRSKIAYMNLETDNKIHCCPDWKEEKNVEDRGDHLHKKPFQKLKIQIPPSTSGNPTKITEPIEKLDNNNWIGDETIVVREKSSHQLPNMDATENVSAGESDVSRRLWDNNMVLMQPAEWSAFYPVESVPSLHLSIETEIEEVPWFRRILRCLKCFK